MNVKQSIAVGTLGFALLVPSIEGFAAPKVRARVGVRVGFGAPVYRARPHYYYGPVVPVGYYHTSRVVRVRRVNHGEVDFNIKPNKSRIYVNGDFLGIADDFDGFPQTAKLPPGRYNIKIVAPNGRIERRSIYVVAGEEINLNIKF